jgi:hypothetical protein
MDKRLFNHRGIDRLYIEGKDHSFFRQNRLEAPSEIEAVFVVEDLERAGFEVVVCEFPMSRWSSLNHIVVYASNYHPSSFGKVVARLVKIGNGRLANKMFLSNGRVSDRPIHGDEEVQLVTAV